MENILNISDSSYGEYATKLNIVSRDGFDKFLKNLNEECIQRSISGVIKYECLDLIGKTLSAFDKVEFEQDCVSLMLIKNWYNLSRRIDPNMTERECMKWVLNGMINGVVEIIDEDIRYGIDNPFYKNLRDFLCLISIRDE